MLYLYIYFFFVIFVLPSLVNKALCVIMMTTETVYRISTTCLRSPRATARTVANGQVVSLELLFTC